MGPSQPAKLRLWLPYQKPGYGISASHLKSELVMGYGEIRMPFDSILYAVDEMSTPVCDGKIGNRWWVSWGRSSYEKLADINDTPSECSSLQDA